jgi:carboxymethylenebutenolidase
MGEMIDFASNGKKGTGYFATPPSGEGMPLIVIQEWWGLNDHIKSVTDRFAAKGFMALAPDLYHGAVATEPDEAGKAMMGLDLARAAKDLSGAVDELIARSSNGKVAVVGFCMGGGLALTLACQRPDAINACVPFYGVIPWPDAQPDYSQIKADVQGHYATKDTFATPEQVALLTKTLRSQGNGVEMYSYDADHAFFNDTRPEVYVEKHALEAFRRTCSFLLQE